MNDFCCDYMTNCFRRLAFVSFRERGFAVLGTHCLSLRYRYRIHERNCVQNHPIPYPLEPCTL